MVFDEYLITFCVRFCIAGFTCHTIQITACPLIVLQRNVLHLVNINDAMMKTRKKYNIDNNNQ